MSTMLPYDTQLSNEHKFSRKHLDKYLRKEIEGSEAVMEALAQGVTLLTEWANGEYYASKMKRIAQLKRFKFDELVMTVIIHTCYFQRPELFTSVCVQLASRLGFDEREEGIKTAGELLAVLTQTDCYDIIKPRSADSLMLKSNLTFSDELSNWVAYSMYLPPMICEPRTIHNNRQSGYLTFDDNVILKRYNHHNGDVCLDVINLHNKTAFSLDKDFLCSLNEEPPSDLETVEVEEFTPQYKIREMIKAKKENWENFYKQSQHLYLMLYQQGNRFYFTNKVDKRGRMYSQGYHVNPQGSKYKKASLELADKELVEGVPT